MTDRSKFQGPEVIAIHAARISWASLPDDVLAAAFMGATFDAKPRIREQNKSFKPARELNLIDEDGHMHELVFEGLKLAAGRLG